MVPMMKDFSEVNLLVTKKKAFSVKASHLAGQPLPQKDRVFCHTAQLSKASDSYLSVFLILSSHAENVKNVTGRRRVIQTS